MKIIELLENQLVFSVEYQNGRLQRKHDMVMTGITSNHAFTHADKKRIAKLQIGSTLTTMSRGHSGDTFVKVTRIT